MGYFPAKEIQPSLWVGSEKDAEDPSFLRDQDIGYVLTVKHGTPQLKLSGVEYRNIAINDHPDQNKLFLKALPGFVREIDAVLGRGKGVLVHCRAGMQRSAGVVAAYIMFKYRVGATEAMRAVNDKKPETFFPVPTFEKALRSYEIILRNDRAKKSLA